MFLCQVSLTFHCRLEVLVVSYLAQSYGSLRSALACMVDLFFSSGFGQVSLGVVHSQFARVVAESNFDCRSVDGLVDLYVCFIQIGILDRSCSSSCLLSLIFERWCHFTSEGFQSLLLPPELL